MPVAGSCVGRSGTLLITGGGGVDAAAARFILVRQLASGVPGLLALIAAGLAMASLVVFFQLTRVVWFLPADKVAIGPSWTLQGSWLTNLGALGALLSGVLGASNYLSDFVPGLSTTPFVGLNLVFGATVVAAPVVYYAFSQQRADPAHPGQTVTIGNGKGVTPLMVITLFGIYGELATLAWLVYEASRPWHQTGPLLVA